VIVDLYMKQSRTWQQAIHIYGLVL
jgi:hypothetical protein